MSAIVDPHLEAETIEGKPGRRRLVVTYGLELDEGDIDPGADVLEQATIRSCDLHDSPTPPEPLEVRIERRDLEHQAGMHRRELSCEIKRVDLDVQRDWWRTDHGGGIEAIAELPDHLVAEVSVRIGDRLVAEATTPVTTGSWGALGED